MTTTAERNGPPTADTNPDTGERWYIHPTTGERFVSVTTVLKVIDKPALVPWGAKMGAQAAMDNLPAFVKAARRRPCERTGQERCGTCRECVVVAAMGRPFQKSREAADRGSRVHAIAEQYALSGEIRSHDEDIAPYVQSYLTWFCDYQPEYIASECTVINRAHGFAGTCDGIIRLGQQTVAIDAKTADKTRSAFYAEYALQLAPYRHAEAILLPDGTEHELPQTDSAAVLSLRPNGYAFRPVNAGPATFAAFLAALALWKWRHESGNESVKGKDWPLPSTPNGAAVKPARKRAPAKTNGHTPGSARTVAQRIGADPLAAHAAADNGRSLNDTDLPF